MRLIAVRVGLPELKHITAQPTIHEAVRVSIHYHDSRAPDSVATLELGHGDACRLHLVYDKSPRPARFELSLPRQRYYNLLVALRRARFDFLDDDEALPYIGVDLWLVERAAGSFYHDVVLSPANARGHHREVMLALRHHLAEVVRQGAG
jgi:hypothetical protein